MRLTLRRLLAITAVGVLAAFGATTARAATLDNPPGQLVDISHQLQDMQKQLAQLQAKGQLAKIGKLSALANCGYGDSSQVFLPWGDIASYSLIPGGDLTSTGAWTLKNISLADDHDPFTAGTSSLVFARGDSEAVTPVLCVNVDNPTLRLFVADRGGNGRADLDVNVIYEGLDGGQHSLTLAKLRVNEQWQPSVVIPIGVNLLSAASASGWTPVAFDFKVHGLQKNETFSLDGVYVDPYMGR